MTIDLLSEAMLGHWDVNAGVSQCEYQFGRRLIFVQHPKDQAARPYIEAAQVQVQDAWLDIDDALRFAEQLSRSLIPDFWEVHDRSGKMGSRFDVYSIHFNYPDSRPTYHVSLNHDFEYSYTRYDESDLWQETPINEQLPEPPDRFFVQVRRLGPGVFENAA